MLRQTKWTPKYSIHKESSLPISATNTKHHAFNAQGAEVKHTTMFLHMMNIAAHAGVYAVWSLGVALHQNIRRKYMNTLQQPKNHGSTTP